MELVGVWPQPQRVDLVLSLVGDVGGDHVVGEHVAGVEEVVVGLERQQRLVQAGRHLRHLGQLLRREVVEVLVDRVGGLGAVLDPVDARQEHGRERQVDVRRGVGAAELDPLGLGALLGQRDPARRRPVPLRVHEVHRGLVARDQPLVGVRGGVREGDDGAGVGQEPTDVPAADVRQPGVPGLGVEERVVALPDRLVGVHAGAVVLEQRLGHEGDRLAEGVADVLHHVLEGHQLVGHVQQGVEAHPDLTLPPGRHLVVVQLHRDAQGDERRRDLRAQVLVLVHRRDGEVALLGAGLVAEVRALVAAGVPGALDRVDHVHRRVAGVGVPDVVEDEELGLGAEVGLVGDAGGRQVRLRLLGHVAGVTGVGLAGDGVMDEAVDVERLAGPERVEVGGVGVRDQDHVRFLDLLEPSDRRAVEAVTVSEDILGHLAGGHGDVLDQTG